MTLGGRPVAFLDAPGGTQTPAPVLDAMRDCLVGANFPASRRAEEIVREARLLVRLLVGGTDEHVVAFGANMTTLSFALARAVGRVLGPGDEVVVTDLDHGANREPWLNLAERGVTVRSAPLVAGELRLDMDALASLIGPRTRLVAVGYASNAVATITDVRRVAGWARRAGAMVVVDAMHYVPYGVIDVAGLDCDFLFFGAYKLFGPHLGALIGKRAAFAELKPDRVPCQLAFPPYMIETGTMNYEGIAGTGAAVRFVALLGGARDPFGGIPTREEIVAGMNAIIKVDKRLGARLGAGLKGIPGVTVYGPPDGHPRTPACSFAVAGALPRDVTAALADRGVIAWSGFFCTRHLMEALGLDAVGGLVRAGAAPYNTAAEVDRFLATLAEVVEAAAQKATRRPQG